MKLTLGFSPCPNDTFIFDAMVNGKIDTGGLVFDVVLEDVETLNQWALEGKLDITKLSFPAFFRSLDNYKLLPSGSALGKGVGPLLIRNKPSGPGQRSVSDFPIVLPGINTTANLLFSFAYPEAKNKIYMRFDAIEDFILSTSRSSLSEQPGEVLGVIIHENRFTYRQKGLELVADLGAIWEQRMNVPVPLGGIAVHKRIDHAVAVQTGGLIRKSLEYALARYPLVPGYVKQHAQTMSEDVMRRHIELYVNDFTLDPGPEGRNAITVLYRIFMENQPPGGPVRFPNESLFL